MANPEKTHTRGNARNGEERKQHPTTEKQSMGTNTENKHYNKNQGREGKKHRP